MRSNPHTMSLFLCVAFCISCAFVDAQAQGMKEKSAFDRKVMSFLDSRSGRWRDMNIPTSDGKLLNDIIVKNKYTRALEIGTSTGHSGIWIAWALSKTGGKKNFETTFNTEGGGVAISYKKSAR